MPKTYASTKGNSGTVTSVSGTSNRITVSTGTTTPVIDISASYVGQSSITTLGTITTGVWTGTSIAIANGGTGQITANAALNALLPSQTSNSGKFLTTDGTNTSWGAGGTGTVTSVSVTTANGVSGTVATSTTTPAITLTLGAITPTTVNGNTFTTGTFTLTGAAGKTLTFNNSITLTGTDAQTYTFPTTSATIARTDAAQTFSGVQSFNGGIQSSTTNVNSNLLIQSTTGATSISTAQYEENSNAVFYRVGMRGSTSTAITAGQDSGNLILGKVDVTEAGSGVHALISNLVVLTPTITNGTATTTSCQCIYVGDAPASVATNNWSINAGASQFRSNVTISNGNLTLGTAGNKLLITSGSNASIGTATLSSGTVTVSTTAVTASSKIFLTDATTGVLTNVGSPTVGTITAGVSFVINSTNVLDTSAVNWLIIN